MAPPVAWSRRRPFRASNDFLQPGLDFGAHITGIGVHRLVLDPDGDVRARAELGTERRRRPVFYPGPDDQEASAWWGPCGCHVRDDTSGDLAHRYLSLIHISEPTRLGMISYAVFCLKKKKPQK